VDLSGQLIDGKAAGFGLGGCALQHPLAGAAVKRRLDERIFLLKLIRHRLGVLQARGGVPNQLAFLFRSL